MASFDSSNLTHIDVEEMLIAVSGEIKGLDTDDNEYNSIQDLWNSELKPIKTKKVAGSQAEQSASQTEWYSKAFDFWESDVNCPITDGKRCGLMCNTWYLYFANINYSIYNAYCCPFCYL